MSCLSENEIQDRLLELNGWNFNENAVQKTFTFETYMESIGFINRLAEIAGEYLKKGSQVYIEGRLQTRKWQDKDGVDRYTTEIVAGEMQMLGSKTGGTAPLDQAQSQYNTYESSAPKQTFPGAAPTTPAPISAPAQTTPTAAPQNTAPTPPPYEDFDDDIPF